MGLPRQEGVLTDHPALRNPPPALPYIQANR